jgi:hypothetical protein
MPAPALSRIAAADVISNKGILELNPELLLKKAD